MLSDMLVIKELSRSAFGSLHHHEGVYSLASHLGALSVTQFGV